jgi:bifunctional pyridoxal-dependent enzyme with beta-cystathionase and maltose regulon repressor activities
MDVSLDVTLEDLRRKRGAKWTIYDPDVLPAWVADMDFPLAVGAARYEMDLDQLRSVIDERTRMVLFCNPHNPTGRVFERRELEGLAEIALEHDPIVVSDEIHSDLAHSR